jgi:hypothetical protein
MVSISKEFLPSVTARPHEAVQGPGLPPQHTRGRLPEDGLAKTDEFDMLSVSKVT